MIVMKPHKKITIDVLAGMMNHSFDHLENKMNEGFTSVNIRVDKVESRLEKVEKKLEDVDERLEKVESTINLNNENRLSRVEDDIRKIKTKLEL